MAHVKGRSNLAVNGAGSDLVFDQLLFLACRHSVKESLITEGFTIFHKTCLSHFVRQIVNIFAFCLNAPFFCDTDQFLGIFYFVVPIFVCAVQSMTDLTSVIGMCRCSACCEFKEVSSYNSVCVASADSSRSLRSNTARSHGADTAADALLSELTVWSLIFHAELP